MRYRALIIAGVVVIAGAGCGHRLKDADMMACAHISIVEREAVQGTLTTEELQTAAGWGLQAESGTIVRLATDLRNEIRTGDTTAAVHSTLLVDDECHKLGWNPSPG